MDQMSGNNRDAGAGFDRAPSISFSRPCRRGSRWGSGFYRCDHARHCRRGKDSCPSMAPGSRLSSGRAPSKRSSRSSALWSVPETYEDHRWTCREIVRALPKGTSTFYDHRPLLSSSIVVESQNETSGGVVHREICCAFLWNASGSFFCCGDPVTLNDPFHFGHPALHIWPWRSAARDHRVCSRRERPWLLPRRVGRRISQKQNHEIRYFVDCGEYRHRRRRRVS